MLGQCSSLQLQGQTTQPEGNDGTGGLLAASAGGGLEASLVVVFTILYDIPI